MDKTIEEVIKELELDITYFTNLGFENLANKFRRDLNAIKGLTSNNGG